MSRCEDEQMWEKMWEKMWRWADVREDVKMSRCERRCEDEQMWRWADMREDVKMSRCEDEQMWEKMWRWADVKMSRCERRCEDEQMWEKMWRWEDVKEKCEDEKMLRRCEDEKMLYRPPLLEEPCAQTLSGKRRVPLLMSGLPSRNENGIENRRALKQPQAQEEAPKAKHCREENGTEMTTTGRQQPGGERQEFPIRVSSLRSACDQHYTHRPSRSPRHMRSPFQSEGRTPLCKSVWLRVSRVQWACGQ